MKKKKDEKSVMETTKFIKNAAQLRELKIFNEYSEKFDNKANTVTYTIYDNYVLLESPLYSIQNNVLRKYCSRCITDAGMGKSYFVFADSKFYSTSHENQLKDYPVNVLNTITLTKKSNIQVWYNRNQPKFSSFKEQNYNFLNALLRECNKDITYFSKPKPKIYFCFREKLESFVSLFSSYTDVNKLFGCYILPRTLLYETGANRQTNLTSIYITSKSLVELLPARFPLKSIQKYNTKHKQYAKVCGDNAYCMQFTPEFLQAVKNEFESKHWITLPVSMLQNLFQPTKLGRTGLPFLLTTLYAYQSPTNTSDYLLTTWLKVAKIPTARGTKYACDFFNKRMEVLKEIGLVNYYDSLSQEHFKYPAKMRLHVRLNNFKYF